MNKTDATLKNKYGEYGYTTNNATDKAMLDVSSNRATKATPIMPKKAFEVLNAPGNQWEMRFFQPVKFHRGIKHAMYRRIYDFTKDDINRIDKQEGFYERNPDLNPLYGSNQYDSNSGLLGYDSLINPAKAHVNIMNGYNTLIEHLDLTLQCAFTYMATMDHDSSRDIVGGMKPTVLRALCKSMEGMPMRDSVMKENRRRASVLIKTHKDRGAEIVLPCPMGPNDDRVDTLTPIAQMNGLARHMQEGSICRRPMIETELSKHSPGNMQWNPPIVGDTLANVAEAAEDAMFADGGAYLEQAAELPGYPSYNVGYFGNWVYRTVTSIVNRIESIYFDYFKYGNTRYADFYTDLGFYDTKFSFEDVMKSGFHPNFLDKDAFFNNLQAFDVPYTVPEAMSLNTHFMDKLGKAKVAGTYNGEESTPIGVLGNYPFPNKDLTVDEQAAQLVAGYYHLDDDEYYRLVVLPRVKAGLNFISGTKFIEPVSMEIPYTGVYTDPTVYAHESKFSDDVRFLNMNPEMGCLDRELLNPWPATALTADQLSHTYETGNSQLGVGHAGAVENLLKLDKTNSQWVSELNDIMPVQDPNVQMNTYAAEQGLFQPYFLVMPEVNPRDPFQRGTFLLATKSGHARALKRLGKPDISMEEFVSKTVKHDFSAPNNYVRYKKADEAFSAQTGNLIKPVNGDIELVYPDNSAAAYGHFHKDVFGVVPIFIGCLGNISPAIYLNKKDVYVYTGMSFGAALVDDANTFYKVGLLPRTIRLSACASGSVVIDEVNITENQLPIPAWDNVTYGDFASLVELSPSLDYQGNLSLNARQRAVLERHAYRSGVEEYIVSVDDAVASYLQKEIRLPREVTMANITSLMNFPVIDAPTADISVLFPALMPRTKGNKTWGNKDSKSETSSKTSKRRRKPRNKKSRSLKSDSSTSVRSSDTNRENVKVGDGDYDSVPNANDNTFDSKPAVDELKLVSDKDDAKKKA